MKDSNVGKGLKKIVIGQYFAIIATLFMVGASLLINIFKTNALLQDSDFFVALVTVSIISGFVFFAAMIISVIFNFIGFYQASKDEAEFKKAMICAIIVGVFSLIGFVFQIPNGTVYTIFSAASTIFEMFVMIFSISGLINICINQKRTDLAQKGDKLLKFLVITYIITSIDALIIRIFELSTQAKIVSVIFGVIDFILTIVQFVLYIKYLRQTLQIFKIGDGE